MIRIKSDRCGYDGYTCKGTPSLTPIYRTSVMTYDQRVEPTTDSSLDVVEVDESITSSLIDNYNNIPMNIAGFVSNMPIIMDMEYLASSISGCSVTEGIGSVVDKIKDKGEPLLAWEDSISGMTTIRSYMDSSSTIDIISGSFIEFNDTNRLNPGVLEVMANPLPSPIDIEGMPDFDMALDGVIFALYNIGKWQDITNDRITREETKKDNIGGGKTLNSILNSIDKQSACLNFRITYIEGSGDIVFTEEAKKDSDKDNKDEKETADKKEDKGKPKYSVSSGVIYINGEATTIEGIKSIAAPFYIYVMVEFDDKGKCVVAKLFSSKTIPDASTLGKYGVFIGGVEKILIGKHDNNKNQYYYKILHAVCDNIHIDYDRASGLTEDKSGFLYWDGHLLHLIPYKDCKDVVTNSSGSK